MWACDTCQNGALPPAHNDMRSCLHVLSWMKMWSRLWRLTCKKKSKTSTSYDKGKDTKIGGREVCLSRHLGFFGWMWQPLYCLMCPPPHRHGWRIAGERSIRHCWHHTAAQGGIDVCWQSWVSRCCYSEPWVVRELGGEREVLLEWRLTFGCIICSTIWGLFEVSITVTSTDQETFRSTKL